MSEDVFSRAEAFIRGRFSCDAGGHDAEHSLRVCRTAVRICDAEGGDVNVVRLAALLHDVDDRKLFGIGSHAAEDFMRSEGISEEVIASVVSIISQISFKGTDSVVPDTLEGRIVQDADRLDAIGAIGIARAFAYGGSKGRRMHDPDAEHRGDMCAEEYFRSEGTTVNHFYEKLLKLKSLMNTDTAKRMADRRHSYMESFLKEFYDEWEGSA